MARPERLAYNLGRNHMRMEILDFLHREYMDTEGTGETNPIIAYQLSLIRRLCDHLAIASPDVTKSGDDLPPLPPLSPEEEERLDNEVLTPRPGRGDPANLMAPFRPNRPGENLTR